MDNISKHISYLLLSCKKVDIAGLGCFSSQLVPASFDLESRSFFPSKVRVNFREEPSSDSNLLIASLKRKLKISESEAERKINRYVTRILGKLRHNRFYHLEGLGYLLADRDGNISFRHIS